MATETALTKMEQCEQLIAESPELTNPEVAERIGCNSGTVARARQRLQERSSEPRLISIEDLVTEPECAVQMRPEVSASRVKEFSTLMQEGVEFDAIEVYETEYGKLLTDGWTRIAARLDAGMSDVMAIVRTGSVEDAVRAAAIANTKGSLPRCRETKKNAVTAIIQLDGPEMPVLHYATAAGVSQGLAKAVLEEFLAQNQNVKRTKVKKKGGRTQTATNKKKATSEKRPRNREDETREPGDDGETQGEAEHQNGQATSGQSKEESDKAWLESLRRKADQPSVREQLPAAKRKKFDEDALAYKRLHEAGFWPSFLKLANDITGDRKTAGAKGANFTRILSWFMRMEHPKDWVLCHACKGTGKHVDGSNCMAKNCNTNGYII